MKTIEQWFQDIVGILAEIFVIYWIRVCVQDSGKCILNSAPSSSDIQPQLGLA